MTAVNDRLRALPNELFDQVLTHLGLSSIKNLRLTCAPYAAKCLTPAFFAYYSEQETDLTHSSLRRLCQITIHPAFGPAVRRLTVVAVFHDPSSLLARIRRLREPVRALGRAPAAERSRELLDAMGHLCLILARRQEQHGQYVDDVVPALAHILRNIGTLDSLKLEARVVRPRLLNDAATASRGLNWNSLWADCHRVLRIVTFAMSRSRVDVASFSVFNDSFGKVQSRAFLDMDRDLAAVDFRSNVGSKIKNLSLSFSTATLIPATTDIVVTSGVMKHLAPVRIQASDAAARASENFPGVAGLLTQTPNLEGLDLFMYNTLEGAPWAYINLFGQVSKAVRLPKLRRLRLRGIWTTPNALLLFLRSHPDLAQLDLREVHVSGGTWEPILQHLQSMPQLAKLHLENLWSGSEHLVNLLPKNPAFDEKERIPENCYPMRNGVMVHTRDINVEELRQGLDFVKSRGSSRGKGSRHLMKWIQRRKTEYGPPEEAYFNSR